MLENSIHSVLIQTFSKSNKEIWKQVASQEIERKDPFIELSWKSTDELVFFPYYENEDVTRLQYLKNFRFTVADNSFHGPRKWLCAPAVDATDEIYANKISLTHLTAGADGIFFTTSSNTDPIKLLSGIEWPHCAVFLHIKDGSGKFVKSLSALLPEKTSDLHSITGGLFWDTIPKKGDVEFYLRSAPNFKSLGFIIRPSTAVDEIAEALCQGVATVEKLNGDKDLSEVFNAIAFSLSVDTAFFESIAKLKALRLLWYQVAQAYQIKSYKPSNLHIHARSEVWRANKFEPHGNMIKSTTSAMASILGGCDSLTVFAEDSQNKMMDRIAKNVSTILREESQLNKVADPVAGSYAIDTMVDAIAKAAWTLFQLRTTK
jgi:methylmalonyl-CoA mutase